MKFCRWIILAAGCLAGVVWWGYPRSQGLPTASPFSAEFISTQTSSGKLKTLTIGDHHSWEQEPYTASIPQAEEVEAQVVRKGRRLPEQVAFGDLKDPELWRKAVPLGEAETLVHFHSRQRRFGQLRSIGGQMRAFNPEVLLVKFHALPRVAALRVEPLKEWDAIQVLTARQDVAFAELDAIEQRQFTANDPLITNQWHHTVIGSPQAWEHGIGDTSVSVAIVDTPFQMDHPDLAAQVGAGWDVIAQVPITNHTGIEHSTLGAGMAGAVVGNGLGIAGAGNCRLIPINIEGALSEMYEAVLWAADHGIRVVNLSWSGAYSDSLNEAGGYLKTRARGILAMAGVNGIGFLSYPAQPHIYCVSMTDDADNQRSKFGDHIDFAAPGDQVLSTTINGGYAVESGTSLATPLFAGVVALLFSINPMLGPEEVINILKNTAVDKGIPGRDQAYGWGRINFAAAAQAAAETRPRIAAITHQSGVAAISISFQPGTQPQLWKALRLPDLAWVPVAQVMLVTNLNQNTLTLLDREATGGQAFYRVKFTQP